MKNMDVHNVYMTTHIACFGWSWAYTCI